jgi:hypothetical protein
MDHFFIVRGTPMLSHHSTRAGFFVLFHNQVFLWNYKELTASFDRWELPH